MLLNRRTALLVTFAAMLVLATGGCHVQNRMYRAVNGAPDLDKSNILVPPPPHLPMQKGTAWPPHPETSCDDQNLTQHPCLAFLEFDEFGETWQKNASGRPSQLQKIMHLIDTAKEQDSDGRPLIITFVHGWKHNALDGKRSGADDPDIVGFVSVLNQLHEGNGRRAILGIYIAWRGNLISSYWPVSQQFTYWNREATAIRVGNASLTDALIEISDHARLKGECKQCGDPILVYVGHSFGALVMERALSQATITRMEREYSEWEEAKAKAPKDHLLNQNIVPLANLVIYVSSAAAASESKQVMAYLASSKYVYQVEEKDEPLFLSITSEADLATGLAFKIGHGVPWLGFKWNGSMRNKPPGGSSPEFPTSEYGRACFDPSNAGNRNTVRFDLAQSDYFMSTTARLPQLWSHAVVSHPSTTTLQDPSCRLEQSGGIYMTCHIGISYYVVEAVQNRCNGTPYWVMQMPKDIVPDHGTIFTRRLIAFLMPIISSTIDHPRQLLKSQ